MSGYLNIAQECDLLQVVSYTAGMMSENMNNIDIYLNTDSYGEKQEQRTIKRKFF